MMPVEAASSLSTITLLGLWLFTKIGLLSFSLLYFFFSLIVIRQVNLMTETLITETAPAVRALAIIHGGLSLGIIMLLIGLLFS